MLLSLLHDFTKKNVLKKVYYTTCIRRFSIIIVYNIPYVIIIIMRNAHKITADKHFKANKDTQTFWIVVITKKLKKKTLQSLGCV